MRYSDLTFALKTALRDKGKTYLQIAADLQLSEATVKRALNREDGSFEMLRSIAQTIEMSLTDLITSCEEEGEKKYYLSPEQEDFLARDLLCLCAYDMLVNGRGKLDILAYLSIDEKSLGRVLRELEEAKLLERMPEERLKLTNSGLWVFLRNGPLQLRFGTAAGHLLVDKLSQYGGTQRAVSPGCPFFCTDSYCTVSQETAEGFVQELQSLFRSFRIRAQRDARIKNKTNLQSFIWFGAFLPWTWEDRPWYRELRKVKI